MAFPVNGIIDDANRANEGPPMTGWGDIVSGIVVSSNAFAPSGPGSKVSYHATILTDPDCEVYATIASDPASNRAQYVLARLQNISGTSFDGYAVKFNKKSGTDSLQVIRVTGGVEAVVGADFNQDLVAPNKFGLEIVGDTLSVYIDTGSGWTLLGTRTDSTYPGAGYLGLGIASGTMDDFGGGELAAAGGGQPPRTMHQMRMRRN